MNVLRGRLGKRKMAKFAGVKCQDVDKSLARLANRGYISYEKIDDKYHFIMFPEPVNELEIKQ